MLKEELDNMSQIELAKIWRFSSSDSPYVQGEIGEYLKYLLFKKYNGITPEISKFIGWNR